jgi:hypothetical protein
MVAVDPLETVGGSLKQILTSTMADTKRVSRDWLLPFTNVQASIR